MVGTIIIAFWTILAVRSSSAGPVYELKLEGAISPASAHFLIEGLERAEEEGAECLVVELDTPGGLMESMRSMVKALLNSNVPVVAFVYPRGSRAASAGVFVTLAAHVAAMAPGTNIGAAHPVMLGGEGMGKEMSEKVTNDAVAYIKAIAERRGRNQKWAEDAVRRSISSTPEEALKAGVIDVIAEDLKELLEKIDGRKVRLPSGEKVLHTKGAEVVEIRMSLRDKILQALSNPNIAYILLILGFYGLIFELSNPGAILPGVIGGICIILAFYALQMLPVNYAGLLLILMGLGLFIADIKVPSHGLLTAGGIVAMTLGSLMLFRTPGSFLSVSLPVILAAVITTAAFFIFAIGMAIKARLTKPVSGKEGLIGERGVARTPLEPSGMVLVHGELWQAKSDKPVREGDEVEVVAVEGLKLKVRKVNEEVGT
ncbi:MAG TPA: nodulation protein NfeD [Candidatus Latescibacteria bacterium]|nr:nodulation protein NfeD [Candidatus Latescibacterota bacterium]